MKKVVYIKILHIAVWPVCVRDWVCVCVCVHLFHSLSEAEDISDNFGGSQEHYHSEYCP